MIMKDPCRETTTMLQDHEMDVGLAAKAIKAGRAEWLDAQNGVCCRRPRWGQSVGSAVQRTTPAPLASADVRGHTLAPRITTRRPFNWFTPKAFFFVLI